MIIVDVETTGLNPYKHSIASIGAVDFYNSSNQFYGECKIWDGAEISQQALEINGFSEKELRDPNKKSLEELIKEFLSWTENAEDRTLAGENPAFDRDFSIAAAEKYGIKWPLGRRTVDLHTACRVNYLRLGLRPPIKNRRTDLDTDKILQYVGLPQEPRPHNALTGAKMEAEAFSRLIYGKPLLKEFESYPIKVYLTPQ